MFRSIHAENRSQTYYAWRGPAMLVLDVEGAAGARPDTGFFFRQTRYLRNLRLEVFREAPHFCSVAEIAPNEFEFVYVYPEKKGGGSDRGGGRHGIRYRDLDLRVCYRVRANGVRITLRITNRWIDDAELPLAWHLSADYADYGEVFGGRKQKARVRIETAGASVSFQYQHPQLELETLVRVDGPGHWTFSRGSLHANVILPRQLTKEIKLDIQAVDRAELITNDGADDRDLHLAAWQRRVTRVDTIADSSISMIANRCMSDIGSLALLEGPQREWMTPAAGIPMYQSLWARDALTTAWQASVFDRGEMAEAILSTVGRLQGVHDDPWRDEQPGRTIRGRQHSPLARLNFNPMGLYYGDYASPFAYIFTLAQLYAWSGEKEFIEKHFDTARRILDWADKDGDIDGDGYLEYKTRSSQGPKHQGWRDAHNAIVYPDGTQVETPIATCEIQGYWFAAQQIMAAVCALLGRSGDAAAYWKRANTLKERFNRDFWMFDENCVALGLDPSKKQIRIVASNAAQALTTGIVQRDRLPQLVARLFEPDMFSGWGIRTISTRNPAYNPLSYHLGSVWPVENGTFLFGLKRFGFEKEIQVLATALYELAMMWRGNRVPECIGGYARNETPHPGAYPQANAPQTWNQSVFPILIQSLLGILPLGSAHLLSVYPVMPEWLPEITLRDLRVGDARVTIRFRRKEDGSATFDVLEKEGTLHVVAQPPIESMTAGLWDRLGALVKDLKAA